MPVPRPPAVRDVLRPAARGALAFLVARIVGAGLLLAQVGLVSGLFGVRDAAATFVLLTLVWAGSVWVRWGVDQILPRRAAEARITGDPAVVGFGRTTVLRAGGALVLVLPPLIWATVPGVTAAELVPAVLGCLVAATAWAVLAVLAALLRGYDAAGRSGLVQSVLPALAMVAGTLAAAALGGSWLTLLACTTAALVVAVPVGVAVTRGVVGTAALRSVLGGRGHDPEQLAAGAVAILGEAGLAAPVLLAAVLDVGAVELGALYAALRVANVFSWAATAVAAVAAPRLAMAIAGGGDTRRVLRRATVAATATSLPLAAVGLIVPGTVLGLVDDAYAPYGALLAGLVAGRLVDACAGPLSEALIVGGRVRLELANMAVFCLTVVVVSLALEPSLGVEALALAVALGTAACSVPRLVQVRRALATSWAPRPSGRGGPADRGVVAGTVDASTSGSGAAGNEPPAALPTAAPPAPGGPRVRWPVLAVVSACAAVDLVLALAPLALPHPVGLFAAVVTVPVVLGLAVLEARRADRGSWVGVATAPVAVAAASGLLLFAVRPVTLWASPRDSSLALTALGFTHHDLTTAAALAALCCAAWTIGYLALQPRPQAPTFPVLPATGPMSGAMLAAGLAGVAIGSLLCAALFVRQGGFAVLTSSPGELHNDGMSTGYAVLGVWLVQGAAIHGLIAWLRGGGRHAVVLTGAATTAALLVSVSMQARGLLAIGVAAAIVCIVLLRPPTRRVVTTGLVIAVFAFPALTVLQQIRSYSQNRSFGEATRLAVHTPPGTLQISDLSVFDNLVVMQQLVPGSAERLGGSSLVAVPLAFVPRAVWPGKPLPVDQQVTGLLYPGSTAGSPIGLPGELWWNFGVLGVLLGAPMVGGLMAMLVRLRRRIRGPGGLALVAVATVSCVAPLTRAMAPMATNTTMALLGVALAGALASGHVGAAIGRVRRRVGDGIVRRADPWRGAAGGGRAVALDGLRGLSALAVVVTHVGDVVNAPAASSFTRYTGAWGPTAVAAFFALSGYLLWRPFVAARAAGRPDPDLGRFLVRRATRVIPAYWVLLTVFGLLAAAPGALTGDWWRYYLFAQVYTEDVSKIVGGISPAWTLDVEMSFYLALAGLALFLRGRLRALPALRRERWELALPALLLATGLGILAFATLNAEFEILRRSLPGTLGSFAFGMLLAVVDVRREAGRPISRWAMALRAHPGLCSVVAVASIAGIAAAGLVPGSGSFGRREVEVLVFLLVGQLAAFALVAPVLLGARPGAALMRLCSAGWMRWCGVVALGVYLSHYPLLTLVVPPAQGIEAEGMRFAVLVVGVGGGSLVVGSLTWLLIERPAIEAVAARLRRRRASGGADAGVRSPA